MDGKRNRRERRGDVWLSGKRSKKPKTGGKRGKVMKPLGRSNLLQLCHRLHSESEIIFSFCCVATHLIILWPISIYCCNAKQQPREEGPRTAAGAGFVLLKRDWVASRCSRRHTVTRGFTSQFPEVESNKDEGAEAFTGSRTSALPQPATSPNKPRLLTV